MRKVGLVIGQLSYGGAEKQTALLAEGLLHAGKFHPTVFCLSDFIEPYGRALQAAGVQLYFADRLKPGVAKLIWLVNKLHQSQCDLIYGVLNVGNVYAGAASLITRLPLITSTRNADRKIPFTIRALSSYFIKLSACIIANSQSCIASLREDLGVHHQCVRLIHNAVSAPIAVQDARTKLRNKFDIPLDAILIGTVALLKRQKRPEFFISVCRELFNSELDSLSFPYHFLWIGDGPEIERVSAVLAELPVELTQRIHFVGTRNDISDCLAAMDVFVLTSAYEGMPNALLEAMAAGLPCVVTNVPGTRDVFTDARQGEEIGVLASNNDPKAFAKQLRELIQDPRRMQVIGSSAKFHINRNFTPEKMLQAYHDTFMHVLVANKSRDKKPWLK